MSDHALLIHLCSGQYIFGSEKSVTQAVLKEYLHYYGKPTSGRRDQQLDRLRKFAANKSEWPKSVDGHAEATQYSFISSSIFHATPSRSRGQATGSSANRTSAKRRREMFSAPEGEETHKSKRTVLRGSKDVRTEADISREEQWVSRRPSSCACGQDNVA